MLSRLAAGPKRAKQFTSCLRILSRIEASPGHKQGAPEAVLYQSYIKQLDPCG